MGEDITITFETLYELLRREKNREDIQELEKNFPVSVRSYLAEKRSMLYKTGDQKMLFSEEEQQKTLKQISNIIKVLRELYDRRETKIIRLAINKSKTKSESIDTANLLIEEKDMYAMLVDILNMNREGILNNMVNGHSQKAKEPVTQDYSNETATEEKTEQTPETDSMQKSEVTTAGETVSDSIKVKFIDQVPKFIDPKLKVHGPFEPEDTAELPVSIADVLIKKGKVEVI